MDTPVSLISFLDQRIEVRFDDLSSDGIVLPERILQIVNRSASDLAMQYSGCPCVVIGIDSLRFIHQAQRSDNLVCHVSVARSWHHRLEILSRVVAEDFRSLEQRVILTAFLTFEVPLDD